ncbi:UNVERIFIED_CONTAM: hypothetical protein ABID98_003560 [Brevibacillus sp. OAP136]
MSQINSGWLTILPSGRWYLQDTRLKPYRRNGKRIMLNLGPCNVHKPLFIGLPAQAPGRIRTRIRWKWSNDNIKIGPLIGILTVGYGSTFRGNRENFKDIFLAGKKLGALVYVFTPASIDWEKNCVRGFVYDEKQGVWAESEFPFPHVVYNRVPTRKEEMKEEVSSALTKISSMPGVTLFNMHFFNKQALFATLGRLEQTHHFLPETRKLDTLTRLRSFCSRYPLVYLKPVTGKAGKGIMRLEQINNRWQLRRVYARTSITKHFASIDAVWEHIEQTVKKKKYIIQQGINLARYKGRPFDIRVLVQKNGNGEWGITGIGIRQAGARSITTHVPRGGSIQSPARVFNHLYGERAVSIFAKIEDAAMIVARSLADEINCLAEMSMDLGLTTDGMLWFFEANAKPEKFDEPAIRQSSLKTLIQYAQHVSSLHPKLNIQVG